MSFGYIIEAFVIKVTNTSIKYWHCDAMDIYSNFPLSWKVSNILILVKRKTDITYSTKINMVTFEENGVGRFIHYPFIHSLCI